MKETGKIFKVKFNELKDVRNFVDIANKFASDIDIYKNRYVIDAKSLLGVLSLDTSEPFEVDFHNNNCEEVVLFEEAIKKYIVQ